MPGLFYNVISLAIFFSLLTVNYRPPLSVPQIVPGPAGLLAPGAGQRQRGDQSVKNKDTTA